MTPRNHEWLGRALVAARQMSSTQLPDLSDVTLIEAWERVAQASGLAPDDIARIVAHAHGLPLADPSRADPAVAERLPARIREEHLMHALRDGPDGLLVATAQPGDGEVLRLLQFAVDTPLRLAVAAPAKIQALAQRHAGAPADTPPTPQADVLSLDEADDGRPAIVQLSDQMLRQAIDSGASDIHIQPLDNDGIVRMRIDGVLRNVAALPRSVMLRLVSRTKLLATMDPTDSLRPQDGRLRLSYRGLSRDVRVSSVPANGAEKLVLRLLGSESRARLGDVGIGQPELGQLAALLQRSQGMVLVTGPTGSGKTTTLYSALAERNDEGVNIATVEDPVEIRLRWLTQIEVNPKAELTFANALRSVLRQDPDIILIGEIRDAETAQIAVQAAITGHLVLATLHTHDALGSIARLMDLGVSRPLLAEALAGASAQRLVRKLCTACRAEDTRAEPEQRWLHEHAKLPRLMKAVGCEACGHSGYRGRLPICQVFTLTGAAATALEEGAPLARQRELALQAGMRTLAQSALDAMQAGDTDLAEVLRVLGENFWIDIGAALHAAPPEVVHTADDTADAARRLPVMIVALDPDVRARVAAQLQASGETVVSVGTALEARESLDRAGPVRAILMDFTGMRAERVEKLLALRDRLGAAAIPILGIREPDDESLDAVLARHPNVVVRNRPADVQQLDALLAQAMAALR